MKRLELIPVALLGALASFMAVQMNATPLASQSPALVPTVTSDAGAVDSTEAAPPPRPSVRVPAVERRDVDDIRTRLAMGAPGTYIDEILASRDSSLARWRDRSIEPLRIWVDIAPPLDAWRREFAQHARDAFEAWEAVGIPVRFTFVVDPAQSDVQVTWVDRFDEQISGKTHWARDENWWITDGSIVLALHHRDGHALDTAAIRAIALHEVGHLLGLDHTADETSIMTPRVRVRDLSNADRATVKLVYSLPAGSIR